MFASISAFPPGLERSLLLLPALTERREDMTTQDVFVQVEPDGRVSLTPATVTLRDDVHYVVWRFLGLPEGVWPELRFLAGNPHQGPFVSLDISRDWIIGVGNRGPEGAPEENEYPYRIVIGSHEATGSLRNEATGNVFAWRPLDFHFKEPDPNIHGTAVPPEWPPKTTG
jgi:hypothetical protein